MEKQKILNIYKATIENKRKNDRPLCIFIGGLPGSGKTNLIERVIEEYSDRDFIVIDKDKYRKFYEDNGELLKNPEHYIEKTRDISTQIEIEILQNAIKDRYDIISVSSMRATKDLESFTYRLVKEAGYDIGSCILSVPSIECALSAQRRYEKQIINNEVPRGASISFLKDVDRGIIETIRMLQSKHEKPFIKIYYRGEGEEELPIVAYDSRSSKNYSCALEAFMNPPHRISTTQIKEQIDELYKSKRSRKAAPSEYEKIKEIEEFCEFKREK